MQAESSRFQHRYVRNRSRTFPEQYILSDYSDGALPVREAAVRLIVLDQNEAEDTAYSMSGNGVWE